MKTIFGFPRTAVALVGIIVAIFLVVIVGMIIIGSAAIRALMAPGVKVEGVSLLALLVTIIVLLTAVFIMLLVLFWCCCRHMKGGREHQLPPNAVAALLQLLPLLPDIRIAMRDIAIALYASGKTLTWIHGNLTLAASAINHVVTQSGAQSNKIEVKKFPNFFNLERINPLQPVADHLGAVANSLTPATYPVRLGTDDLDVGEIGGKLEGAAKDLARMAKRLGAPDVPAELVP